VADTHFLRSSNRLLEFTVIEDSPGFVALEEEWEDLYRNSPLATRFSRGLGSTLGGSPMDSATSCVWLQYETESFWWVSCLLSWYTSGASSGGCSSSALA
jgi:hypothetical protein